MKVRDTLLRDPSSHPLANQGQARIADRPDDRVLQEAKAELSTFVCEGQYADGIQRILSSYLRNLGQTSQTAAWVSGFFGSGKSHFLKMLGHLWQDTQFPDGSTARSLVPSLPEDVRHLLRELDVAGKRDGGLLAAAGSLPSGSTDHVRLTVLSVLLRAVGLPDQLAPAQFCLWLHDAGHLGAVKAKVEASGRTWSSELLNLYVSGIIARAVLECDPQFAKDEADAKAAIRQQFPQKASDITTAEFLATAKRALAYYGKGGQAPCTVLILDEAQQYIGDSNDRSTLFTELSEAVSKQFDSRVALVAAGQSALTSVRNLQKLMDRYRISVSLSDSDVEAVTRKVLLQKRPSAINGVRKFLDAHSGEVSRQLQGTKLGERTEDRATIVDDYPLLPARRRFWEHCFRQIDAAGTQSQLRSQLRIIHDAVAKVSDKPLGAVVPADELFEALAPEMVNTGVLLREINERIIQLSKDGSEAGKLARRVCGVVFLINRLPRVPGADLGIRATGAHVADLLIDDIAAESLTFRNTVEQCLETLASNGTLMRLGDEYRLQTKEGSEWDQAFRLKQSKVGADEALVQMKRDDLLFAHADEAIRKVKVLHGAAKEPRKLSVYKDDTPPPPGDGLTVWLRHGWSASKKQVEDAARTAGSDDHVIHVFLPRQSPEELKRSIIDAEAAQQTLDLKGNPGTDEGQEARKSIESRLAIAKRERDEIIKRVVDNAKVYQGGGSEALALDLNAKLRDVTDASLKRLFPRFPDADSAAWGAVIKRAREGADQPLQPVGHAGPTEQHPVCQQVMTLIGAGKSGSEIRRALEAPPFGWPRDAIDAGLIALHRLQHVSATLNGAVVSPGQLDQNKIPKTDFRKEAATLTVGQRLAIRKLYGSVGITSKGGEEAGKASEFLAKLNDLRSRAGGEAPLPPAPTCLELQEVAALVGNEQLAALCEKAALFETRAPEWTASAALAADRQPAWEVVVRLARHASGFPEATELIAQADAVKAGRQLLQPIDPVPPLRAGLSSILREKLLEVRKDHDDEMEKALATLSEVDAWQKLTDSQRGTITDGYGLTHAPKHDVSSDKALLDALDAWPFSRWETETVAIAGRLDAAIHAAAALLEPKVRIVSLERATLRTEQDVNEWVARQGDVLRRAVGDGPVLVG